jgi:serralysin
MSSRFSIATFDTNTVSEDRTATEFLWPSHGAGCPCGCFQGQVQGDHADGGSSAIQPASAPAGPTLGTAATGSSYNSAIDGVLYGQKYAASVISFSFPTDPGLYGTGYSEATNAFRGVSTAQAAATDWILTGTSSYGTSFVQRYGSVSSFTNLTFVDNGNGDAVIRLAGSGQPDTAYSYYPFSGPQGSDVWFGNRYDGTSADYRNPKIGNYAYMTLVHELGHALGLKHGHEAGGPGNTALPAGYDSHEFSIMTYRSYEGKAIGGASNELYGFPQGFMMLDIAALQFMYGANYGVNAGNTVYSWSPTTGEMFVNGVGQGAPGDGNGGISNRVFLTIWDGGGNDTYDFSNYTTALNVDLNPGGWSKTSAAQLAYLGDGHYARGNVFNALTYQGSTASLIDNAIGGSGDDVIIGNSLANRIKGGGGNDFVSGGGGVDTLVLQGNRAEYTALPVVGGLFYLKDNVAGRDGTDSFSNVEVLSFRDQDVLTQDFYGVSANVVSPPEQVAIFRFYNTKTGTHFYTASSYERDSLRATSPSFSYEGAAFAGSNDADADMSIFRFYNTKTGTHFYTASAAERDSVMKTMPTFSYEGVGYKAFSQAVDASGDAHMALYRFYNSTAGTHFYTASAVEKASIQAHMPAFKYEGVAYYVDAVL